jgi:DNA processing protein
MSASGDREETRALLILDQLEGVGLVRLAALVARFGSGGAALAAPTAAFAEVAGRAAAAQRAQAEVAYVVDRALDRARRLGIVTLTWTSERYPKVLGQLADPPPVLFLRGRIELLGAPTVTVVGARRATSRGRDVAERLGQCLARAGVVTMSGLALGIDGSAHRGALAAGGDTVAVLGTGPDLAYPVAHRRLLVDIVSRGLVISEFLPGTPALPHHFPRRNRILAALAQVVVVVEAGARSGSLITVDHALDLGRDVWVVPGPIEEAATAGSNRLLLDGAHPLLSVSEFAHTVAPDAAPRGGSGQTPAPEGDLEVRALATLGEGAIGIDELAERLGLPVPSALALLTALELRGAVRRLPGMRFRSAA